jgi:hypothetical protein
MTLDILALREEVSTQVMDVFYTVNTALDLVLHGVTDKLMLRFKYDVSKKRAILSCGGIDLSEIEQLLNKYILGFQDNCFEVDFVAVDNSLVLTKVSLRVFDRAISEAQLEEYKHKLTQQSEQILAVSR